MFEGDGWLHPLRARSEGCSDHRCDRNGADRAWDRVGSYYLECTCCLDSLECSVSKHRVCAKYIDLSCSHFPADLRRLCECPSCTDDIVCKDDISAFQTNFRAGGYLDLTRGLAFLANPSLRENRVFRIEFFCDGSSPLIGFFIGSNDYRLLGLEIITSVLAQCRHCR